MTSIEKLPEHDIADALAERDRRLKGSVSPTLRALIKGAVNNHGALNADEIAAILDD